MKKTILFITWLVLLNLGYILYKQIFPDPPCPKGMNTLILKEGNILCITPEDPVNRRNWQPYNPKIKPGKQT